MADERSTGVNANTIEITLTFAQLVQVFDDWEADYRANPDKFLKPEESAVMQIASVSEGRTMLFLAFLRQLLQEDVRDASGSDAA